MTTANDRGKKKRVSFGASEDLFCISPRKGLSEQARSRSCEADEPIRILAAGVSLMGTGGSAGYYLAAAGYFEHNFESQTLFLLMIIVLYMPYPLTVLVQEKLDGRMDAYFTTRTTYFFRVILVQVVLAGVFVAYAFSSKSVAAILVCGLCIGVLSAANLASTMQLVCASGPHLTAWASLGKDLGGVFPVVTYWFFSFSASTATTGDFQRMLCFPGIVLFFCALFGTGLHCAGIWDKAYSRLSYDLRDDSEAGSASESDPLLGPDEEVDKIGVPTWVPIWQFANGFNTFLSFLLMPLVCLRGDPHLTQQLTLAKLLMDCFARATAALIADTNIFGLLRPRHNCLMWQEILRSMTFIFLLLQLLGAMSLHNTFFMCLWLFHYYDGSVVASQIDITIARFVPVAARKKTSRRNLLANYTGLGCSLAVDLIIMFSGKLRHLLR